MWIREGETRCIPGAEGYYLESKEFILEYYTKDEADEVFGEALERVGQSRKITKRMYRCIKIQKVHVPGQSDKMEFVKDDVNCCQQAT